MVLIMLRVTFLLVFGCLREVIFSSLFLFIALYSFELLTPLTVTFSSVMIVVVPMMVKNSLSVMTKKN